MIVSLFSGEDTDSKSIVQIIMHLDFSWLLDLSNLLEFYSLTSRVRFAKFYYKRLL